MRIGKRLDTYLIKFKKMFGLSKTQLIVFAVLLLVFIAIFYFFFFTDKASGSSVPGTGVGIGGTLVNGSNVPTATPTEDNPKPINPAIGRIAFSVKDGVKVYIRGFQNIFKVANRGQWIGTINDTVFKDWYGIQTTSLNETVYVLRKDVKFT